jgi:hypothetical protein
LPEAAQEVQEGLGFRGFVVERELDDRAVPAGTPLRVKITPAAEPELTKVLLESASQVLDPALVEAASETVRPAAAVPPRREVRARRGRREEIKPSEAPQEAALEMVGPGGAPFLTPYRPDFWNRTAIRLHNNCYNYATNFASNTVAQPGRRSGSIYQAFACAPVGAAAFSDGYLSELDGVARVVALAIWPGWDFHWWRLHPDGMWAHKLGLSTARNVDNSGRVIAGGLTPETCARQPYTDFCSYFFVPLGIQVF